MHPYLRFAFAMTRAVRASALEPLDTSRIHGRVLPQDVEVRRMNNGRYVTMQDIGRFDLAVRAGFVRPMFEHKWQPLVRSLSIDFRKSLLLGQRYTLTTRFVCFDQRYFYMDQRFIRDGDDVAVSWCKVLFREKERTVPPAEVLNAMGKGAIVSPPSPESLRLWLASERASRDHA